MCCVSALYFSLVYNTYFAKINIKYYTYYYLSFLVCLSNENLIIFTLINDNNLMIYE